MSQEVIKVILSQRGDSDVLTFDIKENSEDEYSVDLGSSTKSQAQLKRIFTRLLEILIEKDVVLELEIEEGFNRALQKEVSEEYISDLNNELATVKEHITEQMTLDGPAEENVGNRNINDDW